MITQCHGSPITDSVFQHTVTHLEKGQKTRVRVNNSADTDGRRSVVDDTDTVSPLMTIRVHQQKILNASHRLKKNNKVK